MSLSLSNRWAEIKLLPSPITRYVQPFFMKVPASFRGKDKNETVIARKKSVRFTLCSVIIPFDVLAVSTGHFTTLQGNNDFTQVCTG